MEMDLLFYLFGVFFFFGRCIANERRRQRQVDLLLHLSLASKTYDYEIS